MFQFLPATILFSHFKNYLRYTKGKRNRLIHLFNDEMTVTSQLTKSTLCSAEYIIDVPNIAFGPKISRECMGWRPADRVDRCTGQWWLFVHITWRMYDQSRLHVLDSDITMLSNTVICMWYLTAFCIYFLKLYPYFCNNTYWKKNRLITYGCVETYVSVIEMSSQRDQ